MKRFFNFCIIAFLTISCNSNKENYKDYSFLGTATNATVNKKTGIQLQVTQVGDKKYKCVGKFDNKKLFGKFEMDGDEYEDPNFPNALNIRFSGEIVFGGDDGSGFPADTKTKFSSTLNIFPDNATGNYLVYEIPNSDGRWKDEKQNGLYQLTLASKDKNGNATSNLEDNITDDSSPTFEGEWSSNTGWNISITKVSDELYDVKFWNFQTKEVAKKISGSYNFSSYDKSIHRDVPVDYNDSKSALNDMGKEYRITYTNDDRLYLGGTFYTRQQ